MRQSKRALPFEGLAIKFGEACVTTGDITQTWKIGESGWFNCDSSLQPGTLLIPIQCFTDSWIIVTKCIVGGTGITYIDIRSKINRL